MDATSRAGEPHPQTHSETLHEWLGLLSGRMESLWGLCRRIHRRGLSHPEGPALSSPHHFKPQHNRPDTVAGLVYQCHRPLEPHEPRKHDVSRCIPPLMGDRRVHAHARGAVSRRSDRPETRAHGDGARNIRPADLWRHEGQQSEAWVPHHRCSACS